MEPMRGYILEGMMMNAIGVATEWNDGRQACEHKSDLILQSYLENTLTNTPGTVALDAPSGQITILC